MTAGKRRGGPFGARRVRPAPRKGRGLTFPHQNLDVDWRHERQSKRPAQPEAEFSFQFKRVGVGGLRATGAAEGTETCVMQRTCSIPCKAGRLFGPSLALRGSLENALTCDGGPVKRAVAW
jgi:hypothetical protein